MNISSKCINNICFCLHPKYIWPTLFQVWTDPLKIAFVFCMAKQLMLGGESKRLVDNKKSLSNLWVCLTAAFKDLSLTRQLQNEIKKEANLLITFIFLEFKPYGDSPDQYLTAQDIKLFFFLWMVFGSGSGS